MRLVRPPPPPCPHTARPPPPPPEKTASAKLADAGVETIVLSWEGLPVGGGELGVSSGDDSSDKEDWEEGELSPITSICPEILALAATLVPCLPE